MDLNILPSEQGLNMSFTDFELKHTCDFPLAANVQLHHAFFRIFVLKALSKQQASHCRVLDHR
jgi:hypothetical protein